MALPPASEYGGSGYRIFTAAAYRTFDLWAGRHGQTDEQYNRRHPKSGQTSGSVQREQAGNSAASGSPADCARIL